MNKKFMTSLVTLSSAFVLAACGGQVEEAADSVADQVTEEVDEVVEEVEEVEENAVVGELQDGTYRVEDAEFGETGWKEALEITVAGGEITEANWSSLDEDGNEKIESDEYQEAMSGVAGVGPQEFIPELEAALVEVQNPADVDTVTGATSTSDKFKDFAEEALKSAEEGNTETVVIEAEEVE